MDILYVASWWKHPKICEINQLSSNDEESCLFETQAESAALAKYLPLIK